MKKLLLFTDGFPFGNGETFIENEIVYLSNEFDVSIIAVTDEQENHRVLNSNVKIIRIPKPFADRIAILKSYIRILFSQSLRSGITASSETKHNRSVIKQAVTAFARGEKLYSEFSKFDMLREDEEIILYFYWNTYKLLPFLVRKEQHPKWKMVSRIHGYDLFNERTTTGAQVWKSLNSRLDKLFFLSEQAVAYYKNKFDNRVEEYSGIARLGTVNKNIEINNHSQDRYKTIVSCSRAVDVKRIDRIITALSLIDGIYIRWVHIGDGEKKDSLRKLAIEKLDAKNNIVYSFVGYVDNRMIVNYYSDLRPDCYLLTSESEGVPVSIMEALSCGIPIVSTNVGGISEMLAGTRNILVGSEGDPIEISKAVETTLTYDSDTVDEIRQENIRIWNERYNAETNYRQFTSELLDIYNS